MNFECLAVKKVREICSHRTPRTLGCLFFLELAIGRAEELSHRPHCVRQLVRDESVLRVLEGAMQATWGEVSSVVLLSC